jgi:hypothetical protein
VNTAHCALCLRRFPISEILDHLRDAHDQDVALTTWPDGELVVVDATLEPADFLDEENR